jgi:hypothetical protein
MATGIATLCAYSRRETAHSELITTKVAAAPSAGD